MADAAVAAGAPDAAAPSPSAPPAVVSASDASASASSSEAVAASAAAAEPAAEPAAAAAAPVHAQLSSSEAPRKGVGLLGITPADSAHPSTEREASAAWPPAMRGVSDGPLLADGRAASGPPTPHLHAAADEHRAPAELAEVEMAPLDIAAGGSTAATVRKPPQPTTAVAAGARAACVVAPRSCAQRATALLCRLDWPTPEW